MVVMRRRRKKGIEASAEFDRTRAVRRRFGESRRFPAERAGRGQVSARSKGSSSSAAQDQIEAGRRGVRRQVAAAAQNRSQAGQAEASERARAKA